MGQWDEVGDGDGDGRNCNFTGSENKRFRRYSGWGRGAAATARSTDTARRGAVTMAFLHTSSTCLIMDRFTLVTAETGRMMLWKHKVPGHAALLEPQRHAGASPPSDCSHSLQRDGYRQDQKQKESGDTSHGSRS